MHVQTYETEIHLSDYFRVVKNHKSLIAVFFVIVVAVTVVISFTTKPVYRATTTIFIDMESPNVLTATGSVELGGTNYYAYKEYFQSQKEIIKSRSVGRQAFQELGFDKDEEYSSEKDPLGAFLSTIKVEPVRDTRLLLLHVDNNDPELAAKIANHLAETYVARNLAYITKSEAMNLYKNELLKLQAKLSEYSKVYKYKHPQMIRLKQEIEQMVGRINKEKNGLAEYSEGMTSSEKLDKNLSNFVLAGLKANNISVQDPAEVPVYPIRPKKRLNILFAIFVGLFGGIGLAFFFEYLDDTVKDVEEMGRIVNWPFMGNVPDINREKRATDSEKDRFSDNNPKDPIAEAYRTIRTSILFSSTKKNPLRSILITSPGPQEGKSITACNLGTIMSQNQSRVLLVDADMRRPRLHKVFNEENDFGFSNFLASNISFKDVVKTTDIKNLFFVCGGSYTANPSELLYSLRVDEFIQDARQKFDYIIFDSSPIAVVTDAVILSKIVDGTLLVVERGKTNKRVIARIDQLLSSAKASIVGFIMNKTMTGTKLYEYYSDHKDSQKEKKK